MVVVLIILSILTVISTAGTNNAITEQRSASNEQIYELSFYAADTAKTYVVEHSDLYHENNITEGESIVFPNDDNESEHFFIGPLESFQGEVTYLGSGLPPRGSGFEVGKFYSHRYQINSKGFASRTSKSEIEVGFYRVGFKK